MVEPAVELEFYQGRIDGELVAKGRPGAMPVGRRAMAAHVCRDLVQGDDIITLIVAITKEPKTNDPHKNKGVFPSIRVDDIS